MLLHCVSLRSNRVCNASYQGECDFLIQNPDAKIYSPCDSLYFVDLTKSFENKLQQVVETPQLLQN